MGRRCASRRTCARVAVGKSRGGGGRGRRQTGRGGHRTRRRSANGRLADRRAPAVPRRLRLGVRPSRRVFGVRLPRQEAAATKQGGVFSHRFKVRLIAVDRDGGKRRQLLDKKLRTAPRFFGGERPARRHPREDIEHVVVHHMPKDPKHVLVRAARDATPYTSVYRANVEDGSIERVLEYEQGIVFWHADRHGVPRLGTGWYELGPRRRREEPWAGPTAVAVAADGAISRVDVARLVMPIGEQDLAAPRILGFSRDGMHVYYEAAVDDAERTAVWEADAESLAPRRQLAADPLRDVRAAAVGGESCGVVGFMHPLPGRPFTWLDADFGADVSDAAQRLGRQPDRRAVHVGRLPTVSDGHHRRCQPSFPLARSRRRLAARPRLAAPGLGRPRGRISARDLPHPRWEGLPTRFGAAGQGEASAAHVVVILDADAAPDSLERQDIWLHYFAARGYAVVKPAVRGQRGYGWQNHLAGRRLGSFKLRDDVEDALAWLARQGLADQRHACFIGRAAGAHLALTAALGGAPAVRRPSRRALRGGLRAEGHSPGPARRSRAIRPMRRLSLRRLDALGGIR